MKGKGDNSCQKVMGGIFMARRIIPEKAPLLSKQQEQDVSSALNQAKNGAQATSIPEIEELIRSWESYSEENVKRTSTLTTRLCDFFSYKEELFTALTNFAHEMYKPFVINIDGIKKTDEGYLFEIIKFVFPEKRVKVNPFYSTPRAEFIKIFHDSHIYTAVRLSDMKKILLTLDVPYAAYIPEDTNTYVHFISFLQSLGYFCHSHVFTNKITVKKV